MRLWTESLFESEATLASKTHSVGESWRTVRARSPTDVAADDVKWLRLFAFAAAIFLLASFSTSDFAEAELNCDDSWTPAYKCLEGCGPCPDDAGDGKDHDDQPAPPQFDARADARNRIAELVANYTDVIDPGRWGNLASVDDGSFDAALDSLHRELWTQMAKGQADAAGLRDMYKSTAESMKPFEERARVLNGARADGVPQDLIDVKTDLQNKKEEMEARSEKMRVDIYHENVAATFAANAWLKSRNDTLLKIQTAMPQISGLPAPGNDVDALPQPQRPIPDYLSDTPDPSPPRETYSKIYNYLTDANFTHVYTPEPEAAPAADVTAKVAALEQLAVGVRTTRQDLKAAQDANSNILNRYRSLAESVTSRERNVEATNAEITYLRAHEAFQEQSEHNCKQQERVLAWTKTFNSIRAEAWDILRDKVVVPELQKFPHYADIERAKKGADLVQQVLSLEKDAEFYSTAAARLLALGPTVQTAELAANVWGATRQQAEASIDRTMDLIDAPPDVARAWKALLTSEP